jgi:Sap, sulfolipid-1-addressing protein
MQLQLVLLALDAALYPTLLTAVVILLDQPRRLPLLAAYLAGGLTMSIGIGIALVFVLQDAAAFDGDRLELSWLLDLAVGGLALLFAVALATRADARLRERRRATRGAAEHAGTREPISQRLLARGSVPVVFVAALALNVPGAAYLIALKDIAVGEHSTTGVIVLVISFNAVMFTLAEVPLVGLIVKPQQTEELVRRMDAWFAANGRRIAVTLCVALGVFLIVRGIVKAR